MPYIIIKNISIQFGVPVLSGILERGSLAVGSDVQIVRDEETIAQGSVCGILLNGKAVDRAGLGQTIQLTVRGANIGLVAVGDRICF